MSCMALIAARARHGYPDPERKQGGRERKDGIAECLEPCHIMVSLDR